MVSQDKTNNKVDEGQRLPVRIPQLLKSNALLSEPRVVVHDAE